MKIELREESDNYGADIHYDASNNILKINMMDNGTLREALWITRSDGKVDVRQGLKVAGTEVIDSSRNLKNIGDATLSGEITIGGNIIKNNKGHIVLDLSESGGRKISVWDIEGARWAFFSGNYDLTIKKHKADTDTWETAMIFHGDGANYAPLRAEFLTPVDINGNLEVGGNLTVATDKIRTAYPSNNCITIKANDFCFNVGGQVGFLTANTYWDGSDWRCIDTSYYPMVLRISRDGFMDLRSGTKADPTTLTQVFKVDKDGNLNVGGTGKFGGDVTIDKSSVNDSCRLILNAKSSYNAVIWLKDEGIVRWTIHKDGNNDFKIVRYDSSGNYIDTPFFIDVDTGNVSLAKDLTVGGVVKGKGWKNTNPSLSNVTSSRSNDTWYHNTSGKTLFVVVRVKGQFSGTLGVTAHMGPSTSSYYIVENHEIDSDASDYHYHTVSFFVPDGWYYKVSVGYGSILDWYEGYIV
ncbi:MAG: hypothetical protein DRJ03_28610 [Chloroflexi bacterium]|nr:MAG: hypothetical protein DRJ03_28610 [Chloroflexota bacterium]